MITLSIEQVKRMHTKLVQATGGPDGIRSEALLESALESPFQTFDGIDLYPSTLAKGNISQKDFDMAHATLKKLIENQIIKAEYMEALCTKLKALFNSRNKMRSKPQ